MSHRTGKIEKHDRDDSSSKSGAYRKTDFGRDKYKDYENDRSKDSSSYKDSHEKYPNKNKSRYDGYNEKRDTSSRNPRQMPDSDKTN